jgi:pyridinium-3,5-bisthiocarboxylic acid mononucleotide nickel chelatase
MRTAYIDCFSGVSGDMFLGALVDAGVSPKLLEDTVAALDIGARLDISRVLRGGISATKVDVYANGGKDHGHGRGLSEIRRLIEAAAIGGAAKITAIRIFQALGEAEAEIHNTSAEQVHFHEVGAVDAMVDIVCAAVGAESLAVDEWVCSPLNVGGGIVHCAHGTLPVPAPATLKLLGGAPVYSSGPQVELVTPTGAAIVKVFSSGFASFPAMKIERAGYGAGTREFPEHPNLLRLTIGETAPAADANTLASASNGVRPEKITVLEANLDDLSPQVLAYAMERLLAEGALDVFSVPVQMKKSRSGALLTVLAKMEDADRLTKLIFAETTTLGVRRREERRQTLARRWETVDTTWGPVRIKIANMNGTVSGIVSNYAPEYEDCRALAEAQHVPLRTVMQEAIQQYLRGERKG